MNIKEAKTKIELIEEKLIELQRITEIDLDAFEDNEFGQPQLDPREHMAIEYPEENAKIKECWRVIQENVPPGFSIDGNLIRHLSFNQARDWYDISSRDIPRELVKIDEYLNKLGLVAYINTLHSEVARVATTVLDGDYDAALKTVFASLESKIRSYLSLSPNDSAVSAIGKAFREGKMSYTIEEYNDSIRNFLMGVIGFYRSTLVHNPLPSPRNNIESCLSLFALAHETFVILEECIYQ